MKFRKLFYILIYSFLFKNTYQKLEEEIKTINNIHFSQNESFKLRINYNNGKYYVPKSIKDTININIESKNDSVNDYFFKYFYAKEDEKTIIPIEDIYYEEANKELIIPESKYIVVELKNKKNNKSIYLKSEHLKYVQNLKKSIELFNNYFIIDNLEKYCKHNHFSWIIFFSTFCFVTTASAILIYIDIKRDKKITSSYNLSTKNMTAEEYQKLKYTYINRNIFLFACFLMKYIYPISNIFSFYNYDYPRYTRLFILINKILLNILTCSFFYFYILTDTTDFYLNFILIFLCSLSTSLVLYIITKLFTRIFLNYNQKKKEIWKIIFESFRKYIYYNVKKDILFNSKWNLIKNRIITYSRICGNSILKRKPEDKYKIYANNKKKCNQSLSIDYISINNNSMKSQKSEDIEIFSEKKISSTYNIKQNHNNLLSKNNSVKKRKKTFFAKSNEISTGQLYIEKSVESFTLSKLGQNNLKLKTVQAFEDIRNRYIFVNDAKYKETMAINSYTKIYESLEIETLDNYTYISTDSINSQLHNSSLESHKILNNTIATLSLFLLLTLIDYGLITIYNSKEEKQKEYISKCLFPVLLQLTVMNIAVHYLYSFFISILIFRGYGYERKKCFYKLIFKIFVERYIKYIYRIRFLINKYHRELDFIDL
jgi:hypothetical protein